MLVLHKLYLHLCYFLKPQTWQLYVSKCVALVFISLEEGSYQTLIYLSTVVFSQHQFRHKVNSIALCYSYDGCMNPYLYIFIQ